MANKVILMGRLTRDPETRYTTGENQTAVARYTLAVDRKFAKKDGEGQTADFINCVSFGKGAEFADKYFRQGTKIMVIGRLQTGSFINKDGQKVYTTDVVVEETEFAESKRTADQGNQMQASTTPATVQTKQDDSFMDIPEGVETHLPWD